MQNEDKYQGLEPEFFFRDQTTTHANVDDVPEPFWEMLAADFPPAPLLGRGESSDSADWLDRSESTDSLASLGQALSPAEAERKRRLEHRRILAQRQRQKKKDQLHDLQARVLQLQRELELCKRAASCFPPMQTAFHVAERPVTFPVDIAEPGSALQGFAERVAEQMESSRVHLCHLQAKLVPCLAVRVLQWILSQPERFYTEPTSLWFTLFAREVGASPQQFILLMNMRQEYLDSRPVSLPGGAEMVRHAFNALHRSLDDSTQLLVNFMQIFTPDQLVVFFKWVERFGAVCIV